MTNTKGSMESKPTKPSKERVRTMLKQSRLCPNGVVGEKIVLSLKFSPHMWELSTKLSENQLEEIEGKMEETLNFIENTFADNL